MKRLTNFAILTAVVCGLTLGALNTVLPNTASAATSGKNCTSRVFSMRQNKHDLCVEYIQKMLNSVNNAKLVVDHDYGPATTEAVRAWQAEINTADKKMKVDGIVGKQTWGKLCAVKHHYDASLATKANCKAIEKTATTTKATKATTCRKQTFSTTTNNKESKCVTALRQMLNIANGSNAEYLLNAYGGYTTDVADATKAFQIKMHDKNSQVKMDGIVGPQTWRGLCSLKTSEVSRTAYKNLKKEVVC